jgi:hypothetical protein
MITRMVTGAGARCMITRMVTGAGAR